MPTWEAELPSNTAVSSSDRFMFNDVSDSQNSKMDTVGGIVSLTNLQTAYAASVTAAGFNLPEILLDDTKALTLNTKNYTADNTLIFSIFNQDQGMGAVPFWFILNTGTFGNTAGPTTVVTEKALSPDMTGPPIFIQINDGLLYIANPPQLHYTTVDLANPLAPTFGSETTTVGAPLQIMRHSGFFLV